MSNSFPSMISSEPPPLNLSSDDDDSEEFRTPGLKLDLSAEPSPLSTPRKTVKIQSPLSSQQDYHLQSQPCQDTSEKHSLTNGHNCDDDSTSLSRYARDSPSKELEFQRDKPLVGVSQDSPSTTDLNISSSDSPQGSDEFTDCHQQMDEFLTSQTPPIEEISTQIFEEVDSPKSEDPEDPHPNSNSSPVDKITSLNLENIQNFDGALSKELVDCDDSKDLKSGCNFITPNNSVSPVPVDSATSPTTELEEMTVLPEISNQIRRPVDLSGTNSGDLNNYINSEEINYETIQLPSTSSNTDVADKAITESFTTESESGLDEFQDANTDVPVPTTSSLNNEELVDDRASFTEGDDFGDFEAFQSSSEPGYETTPVVPAGPLDEDDDDFGDFSSTSVAWDPVQQSDSVRDVTSQNFSEVGSSQNQRSHQATSEDDTDDFADFQNFQEPTPTIPSAINRRASYSMSPRMSFESSTTLESKFESLVKTVIPKSVETSDPLEATEDAKTFKNIDKELNESKDSHWAHVQDFEESKGLVFKWPNSHCQNKLYRSLNIDTTTIVYTERWGAIEVPRFAASMVEAALLQPEVCPSSMKPNESENSSGVSNTEDSQPSYGRKPLSKEAQQILQQIPDLSFMRSKTLVFPQAAASKNSLL